ncbi:unnamed protein product [Spirodela intermedia]|uniref:Calcineurin-like phosphoesterase domain-containing protein n=1 Tax=Spirodela intermedia TaxID=51605 RepID=A0A7I8ID10_SPIIN|nr:unnamed protein product [Spirodela intermedia]CAA6655707.1 unnamed protein product [Spirodela intermedia]
MVVGLATPSGRFSRRPGAEGMQPLEKERGDILPAGGGLGCCAQHALPARRLSLCRAEGFATRVYVLSDLHTDYEENMAWVNRLSMEYYANTVLLVAGDVAETYKNFVTTMKMLKDRFRSVFFVPGNHDLWCRREGGSFLHSLEKLNALLDVCRDLGVETGPGIVDGVGIVPLYSWYHESFDKEKDISGFRIPSLDTVCKDFHACKWPHELSPKILLLQELCPEKRMLFYPNLPKIIGSDLLETRLRSIHGVRGKPSSCHVFGHTHFCWDAEVDGIRYVQAPLSYPRERRRRMNGGTDWLPFCIYHGGLTDRLTPCWWSDYYSSNKRDPDNVDLAPWVAKFYKQQR